LLAYLRIAELVTEPVARHRYRPAWRL